jgi:hypothetical protein
MTRIASISMPTAQSLVIDLLGVGALFYQLQHRSVGGVRAHIDIWGREDVRPGFLVSLPLLRGFSQTVCS